MICRIEVEGADKCGKDTLVGYLDYMSNRQIPISSRGLLSTLVYNDIYNRFMSTERQNQMIKGNEETLIVLLYGNPDDINLRCKITKEPEVDIIRDMQKFYEYAIKLKTLGMHVLTYNTTESTPYKIAKDVLKYVEEENV